MRVFVPFYVLLAVVSSRNCKNALTCHVLYVNDQQYFLSDQTMQTNLVVESDKNVKSLF